MQGTNMSSGDGYVNFTGPPGQSGGTNKANSSASKAVQQNMTVDQMLDDEMDSSTVAKTRTTGPADTLPGDPKLIGPDQSATLFGGGKWFTSPHLLAFYEVMVNIVGKLLLQMEETMAELTIGMMDAEFSASKDAKELGLKAAELEKKMAMFRAAGAFIEAAANFGSAVGGAVSLGAGHYQARGMHKRAKADYKQAKADHNMAKGRAAQSKTSAGRKQIREDAKASEAQYGTAKNPKGLAKERQKTQEQKARVQKDIEAAESDKASGKAINEKQLEADKKSLKQLEEREANQDAQLKDHDQLMEITKGGTKKDNLQANAEKLETRTGKEFQRAEGQYKQSKMQFAMNRVQLSQVYNSISSGMFQSIGSVGRGISEVGTILYAVDKAWYEGEKGKVEVLMRHFGQLISSLTSDRQDMSKMQGDMLQTLQGIFQATTQNQRISSTGA